MEQYVLTGETTLWKGFGLTFPKILKTLLYWVKISIFLRVHIRIVKEVVESVLIRLPVSPFLYADKRTLVDFVLFSGLNTVTSVVTKANS